MADDKPPPSPALRLVPEVDEATRDRLAEEARISRKERDQRFAVSGLRYPLRSMASNVLRIVRGARKPYQVARDASEVLKAFEEYRDAFGHWPSSYDIGEILRVDIGRGNLIDRNLALEVMTKGGLQLAASTLLMQIPQMAAGEHEMTDGVRLWNKYIAEENAKWARSRSPPKPRTSKPKPKS